MLLPRFFLNIVLIILSIGYIEAFLCLFTKQSREVSRFPEGDYKAARNRQDSTTKTINKKVSTREAPPWRYQPKTVGKLKHVKRYQPHPDVDQDTYMFGLHKRSLAYRCTCIFSKYKK